MKVKILTNQLEKIFRNSKNLSSEDYRKFVINIEILKKEYFTISHKEKNIKLEETFSFRDYILNI